MPLYIGYSTANSNAAWHQGHDSGGSDPSVRLMTGAEVYSSDAADSGRKLLVLKNPATDAPASLSFEVPVDQIDNIATFTPQQTIMPEAPASIHDLLGRPLPRIPQSGYFIIDSKTFRK